MKQQLFGLRKAHIDKLLRQMKIDFTSEYNPLELELVKLVAGNKKLEMEIKERSEKNLKQMNENELWSFGQARLKRVMSYLENQQTIEMEELQDSFAKSFHNINQQIEEIDREIQHTEKLISDLITNFNESLVNNKSTFELKEKMVTDELNEINTTSFLSIEEVAASNYLIEEEVETSTVQVDTFVKSEPNLIFDEDELKESLSNSNTNIWGDIEEWTNYSVIQEIPPLSTESLIQIDDGFGDEIVNNEEIQSQPNNSIHSVISETEAIFNSDVIKSGAKFTEIDSKDEALLEQIDSIKTQYIVGKVAGEDLVDVHGNVIISKNSLITRDAVDKANRIGKLAELIVNMKLSGPGVG